MTSRAITRRVEIGASFGLVLGGALWGLFWLPVRGIAEMGLPGAWPAAIIFGATGLVLSPAIWIKRRRLAQHWRVLAVCGLLTGAALSLYSTSLMLTDVVRSILLFYLTPIWGTLLGAIFLGERLTARRVIALLFGFGGMLVVLGSGSGIPRPQNLGDWLALGSGIAWALGSMRLYQSGEVEVSEQILSFVLGCLTVTAATLVLGWSVVGGSVPLDLVARTVPWALLSALYVMPMLILTFWPAMLLTPGRVGLLLMSEIVVGVASAAALSGEPFGLREFLGTVMIVGASLVEILGKRGAAMDYDADTGLS